MPLASLFLRLLVILLLFLFMSPPQRAPSFVSPLMRGPTPLSRCVHRVLSKGVLLAFLIAAAGSFLASAAPTATATGASATPPAPPLAATPPAHGSSRESVDPASNWVRITPDADVSGAPAAAAAGANAPNAATAALAAAATKATPKTRARAIAESDDPLHLYVSTTRTAVVKDDVPVMSRDTSATPSGVPTPFYVADEAEHFTPFYVSTVPPTPAAGAEPPKAPTVLLHKPFIFTPPQALRVSVPGWGNQFTRHVPTTTMSKALPAEAGSLTLRDQAAADPLAFTLEYQCLQKGEHTVRMNLRFVIDDAADILANVDLTPVPSPNGDGDAVFADDAAIKDIFSRKNKRFHHTLVQFTKRCGDVDLSDHRSAVPGFSVVTHMVSAPGRTAATGTTGGDETYAIKDGEATNEFLLTSASSDAGPLPMFTLPPSELALPFVASYTPPSASAAASLSMLPVTALAHDFDALEVHIIGRGAKKTALVEHTPTRFAVRTRCLKEGSWLVSVTFSFEDLGTVAPRLTFVKVCSGPDNTAADATTGLDPAAAAKFDAVIVPGLSVSTEPLSSSMPTGDIAHDGNVQQRFGSVASAKDEDLVDRLVVPATSNDITLYVANTLAADDANAEHLHIDAVAAMSYPRGIVAPIISDIYEWTDIRLAPGAPAKPLVIKLACLGKGTAQVVLHIDADDNIKVVFSKVCAGPSADASSLSSLGAEKVIPSSSSTGPSTDAAAAAAAAAVGSNRSPDDMLPGVVVALTSSPEDIDSIAVHHGVSHADFNPHLASPTHALRVPASQHFITFFVLIVKPQDEAEAALYKPVRFGRPVLTTTFDVADPAVSGYGSEGATLTSSDVTYSLISLTFHCHRPGTTSVMVSLPLLPVGDEPVAHRAHEHITFFLEKACFTGDGATVTDSAPLSASGLGGVGLPGLSVGLSPKTHEVVRDGFPTQMYFNQRTRQKPQWEAAIVSSKAHSMTVYLHYSLPRYEDVDPDELLISTVIPFSAPTVTAHSSAARPVLSGEASAGGMLTLKGTHLELDITFNCQYAELVPVTVSIPIEPKGTILFTIPKQCDGKDAPRGKTVPGIQVAALTLTCHTVASDSDHEDTRPVSLPAPATDASAAAPAAAPTAAPTAAGADADSTAVVPATGAVVSRPSRKQKCKYSPVMVAKDGVVNAEFSATASGNSDRFIVGPSTSKTPFFIRRTPKKVGGSEIVNPVFGTEPMVFAHRPICRPSLVHNMNFDVDAYLREIETSDDPSSASADALTTVVRTLDTVPITIDKVLRSLNVTYHCTWSGRTPITVAIPIYPDTVLSFYYFKECPDVDTKSLDSRIDVGTEGASAGVISTPWDRHDEGHSIVDPSLIAPPLSTGTAAAGAGSDPSDARAGETAAAAAAASYGVAPSLVFDKNLVGYIDIGTEANTFDGRANVVYRGIPRSVYRAFRAPDDEDLEGEEGGSKDPVVDYPGAEKERRRLKMGKGKASAKKQDTSAAAASRAAAAAAATPAAAAAAPPAVDAAGGAPAGATIPADTGAPVAAADATSAAAGASAAAPAAAPASTPFATLAADAAAAVAATAAPAAAATGAAAPAPVAPATPALAAPAPAPAAGGSAAAGATAGAGAEGMTMGSVTETANEMIVNLKDKLSSWTAWMAAPAAPRPGLGQDPLEAEEEALLANIDPDQEYAIIPPSQKSSRFYFSLPPAMPGKMNPYQPFLAPFSKTLHNAYGQQIVGVRITGPAAKGGNLTWVPEGVKKAPKVPESKLIQLAAGAPSYIDVHYKCLRPGYTSVLVAVPLLPHSLGSVSFRVVKLCSGVRPKRAVSAFFSLRTLMLLVLVGLPVVALLIYSALYSETGRNIVSKLGLARLSVALGFDDAHGSLAGALDLPRTGMYAGLGSAEYFNDEDESGVDGPDGSMTDTEASAVEMTSDIGKLRRSSAVSGGAAAGGSVLARKGAASSATGVIGKSKRVTFADELPSASVAQGGSVAVPVGIGAPPVDDIDAELEDLLKE